MIVLAIMSIIIVSSSLIYFLKQPFFVFSDFVSLVTMSSVCLKQTLTAADNICKMPW